MWTDDGREYLVEEEEVHLGEHHECPCCGSLWGLEEIDWQECDACGWPDEECETDDQ